jgi:exo-beta-1,3-glucanase (GH17 family)
MHNNALRDIDNLYGGRMMSPSPEPYEPSIPEHVPYGRGESSTHHNEPEVPMRPRHQATDSQSSVTPLLPTHTYAERRPQPPRSPPSAYRKSVPLMEAANARTPYGYGTYDHDLYNNNTMPSHQFDGTVQEGPYEMPASNFRPREHDLDDDNIHSAPATIPLGRALSRFSTDERKPERIEFGQQEHLDRRRRKWMVIGVIGLVVVAAIVGGVVGGVLGSKSSSSTKAAAGSSSSGSDKGLYDINSPQVKALLNNDALRRIFPGMDYTPLNAQYPDCLATPPDQNNITLDMAMLSQLTPAVRLYGTDCNQTEMVLTAIDRLNMNSSLQVWLGVWLGNNATTNDRQLAQMYDILDQYPSSHFAGIIVGNEVLFRKDLTEAELGQHLQDVRNNLTAKSISLPVSASDLGDDWTASLAADTDIVMSNIHPFFAGVTPDQAPGWSWSFWQTHDVVLATSDTSKGWPHNIISEIGWPSEGGNDCGTSSGCPNATTGAVASIDNMNAFMDGWVCQAMANSTTYFW